MEGKSEKQIRRENIVNTFTFLFCLMDKYKSIDDYMNTLNEQEKIKLYKNISILFKYIVTYANDNHIKPATNKYGISYFIYCNNKNVMISLNNDKYSIRYVNECYKNRPIIYENFIENRKSKFCAKVDEYLNNILINIRSLETCNLDYDYILDLINKKMDIEHQKKLK